MAAQYDSLLVTACDGEQVVLLPGGVVAGAAGPVHASSGTANSASLMKNTQEAIGCLQFRAPCRSAM